GDVVLADLPRLGIDPAHLAVVEAAVPDHAGRVDAEPANRARLREGRVLGELLRARIELADLAGAKLGEPDVVVPVHRNPVRRRAGGRHLPHGGLAGLAVPLADHVAADHGEPHVLLAVHDRAVAASLLLTGGATGGAARGAGLGREPAEVEADGLCPPHVPVGVDGEAVGVGLGIRHHPVLELTGARVDATDAVGHAAIGVPDVAVAIEVRLLRAPLLVASVDLLVERQVVFDVHRLAERRLVDREFGVHPQAAPDTGRAVLFLHVREQDLAILGPE